MIYVAQSVQYWSCILVSSSALSPFWNFVLAAAYPNNFAFHRYAVEKRSTFFTATV
jgi:hypothetical protein